MSAVLARLPLTALVESPFNPRKTFDPDGLAQMAETIKSQGGRVQQPIKVRPLAQLDVQATHEIVFGHRRYRACAIADCTEIDVLIEDMTDEQVVEAQQIENIQREDVSPVEEGRGYRVLIDDFGHTVEDIMQITGKGRSYVYGRMSLLKLASDIAGYVSEAVGLAADTAIYIAKLPLSLQNRGLDAAREYEMVDGRKIATGWLPHRKAKSAIAGLMVDLTEAEFSLDDEDLAIVDIKALNAGRPCSPAGSCTTCPKRSGNDVTLEDLGPDVCTDRGCFTIKVHDHRERIVNRWREQGGRVLEGDQAKAANPPNGYLWPAVKLNLYLPDGHLGQMSIKEAVEHMVAQGQPAPEMVLVAEDLDKTAPVLKYPEGSWLEVQAWFRNKYEPRATEKTRSTPPPAAQAQQGAAEEADEEDDDSGRSSEPAGESPSPLTPVAAWPLPNKPAAPPVKQAASPVKAEADPLQVNWFDIRRAVMHKIMGSTTRTTEELRMVAMSQLAGDAGGDEDVHEALGWDIRHWSALSGDDETQWFKDKLDQMSAYELGALVVMLSLIYVPFFDDNDLRRVEMQRLADVYGVDIQNPYGVAADEAGDAGKASAADGRKVDEPEEDAA